MGDLIIAFVAIIFINIAFRGNLGSLLASIIAPDAMVDK